MTFATDTNVDGYSWASTMPRFSSAQLEAARVSDNYPHSSAPVEMPERVRLLAEEITSGHATPYMKPKAIEQYLKTNYTYRFADPLTGGIPDWE